MNTTDKESLRIVVLEALTNRAPAPVTPRHVLRIAGQELPFELELTDVDAALEYWHGLGNAQFTYDDAGPTKWWTATTKGIQHVERK